MCFRQQISQVKMQHQFQPHPWDVLKKAYIRLQSDDSHGPIRGAYMYKASEWWLTWTNHRIVLWKAVQWQTFILKQVSFSYAVLGHVGLGRGCAIYLYTRPSLPLAALLNHTISERTSYHPDLVLYTFDPLHLHSLFRVLKHMSKSKADSLQHDAQGGEE